MKLSLKYFLLLSLAPGAIAIPVGYKYFRARRAAEIERLTTEWDKALIRLNAMKSLDLRSVVTPGKPAFVSPLEKRLKSRITAIEARLEKLTGKKPQRPSPIYEETMPVSN